MLGLSNNLHMNLKVHNLTAAHHAAARVEEEGCVPAMPHAHKLVDIRGSEAHLQTTDQSLQRTSAKVSQSQRRPRPTILTKPRLCLVVTISCLFTMFRALFSKV